MELTELARVIRFDNASKGFDPTDGGVERYYLLTISEICEAQNELRDGYSPLAIYYEGIEEKPYHAGASLKEFPPHKKPEGFPIEIADAIIRILDIQAKMNYDVRPIGGNIRKDADISIDKELLAVCEVIASCFRESINKALKLNMALSALLTILDYYGIDAMNVIELKLAFNRTRPPKHGRKF